MSLHTCFSLVSMFFVLKLRTLISSSFSSIVFSPSAVSACCGESDASFFVLVLVRRLLQCLRCFAFLWCCCFCCRRRWYPAFPKCGGRLLCSAFPLVLCTVHFCEDFRFAACYFVSRFSCSMGIGSAQRRICGRSSSVSSRFLLRQYSIVCFFCLPFLSKRSECNLFVWSLF